MKAREFWLAYAGEACVAGAAPCLRRWRRCSPSWRRAPSSGPLRGAERHLDVRWWQTDNWDFLHGEATEGRPVGRSPLCLSLYWLNNSFDSLMTSFAGFSAADGSFLLIAGAASLAAEAGAAASALGCTGGVFCFSFASGVAVPERANLYFQMECRSATNV